MTDPIKTPSLDQLKDPTKLTRWTIGILYAHIGIAVIAWIALLVAYVLMLQMPDGGSGDFQRMLARLHLADQSRVVIGLIQIIIWITSIILILKWIYRMNDNAHQLGAADMEFTPGWAVGWYFVPFASLVKPYQSMKEIWKTSIDPKHWQQQPASALLPWWWFFFLAENIVGRFSGKAETDAKTPQELMDAFDLTQIHLFMLIVACGLLIQIIRKIYQNQTAAASLALYPPVDPETTPHEEKNPEESASQTADTI